MGTKLAAIQHLGGIVTITDKFRLTVDSSILVFWGL